MYVIIHHFPGEGNLIEEQTEIINKCEAPESGEESGAVPVMIIGNNNVFEVVHIHISDTLMEKRRILEKGSHIINDILVCVGWLH